MIVQSWCVKEINPWVRLNGLFDFCTPWNCRKIVDFLMVLGEGRSLTGLLELVLYSSVNLGMFHWCYVGIPLIFWSVLLMFRVMLLFRHYSGVFCCSAGVPCSGVPGFIVRPSKYIVFLNSFLYSHLST